MFISKAAKGVKILTARPLILPLVLFLSGIALPQALAAEHTVYAVQPKLNLGNPGEINRKDFFINLGTAEGLKVGATVEVLRRISTYDLLNQKLYKDMSFPIATLKIIHVENNAAIARLEKFYSDDQTPTLSPYAVMVGDLVRPL